MAPTARVCHSMPGRLRIRIDACRRDETFFGQLAAALAGVPGVLSVQTNPITATVLIAHTLDPQRMCHELESLGCLSLVPSDSNSSHAAGPPSAFAAVGGTIGAAPRIPADARGLAILALFGMAIHQAIEGNVMVPAVSLLWYAFNLLERRDHAG